MQCQLVSIVFMLGVAVAAASFAALSSGDPILAPQSKSCDGKGKGKRKCEEIRIKMCGGIGYNYTSMPTAWHDSQADAELEIYQFLPLVRIRCSDDLLFFLCSLYVPACVKGYDRPLSACRSVCERVKAGCAPLMERYGYAWPDRLSCENLPLHGDKENLCLDFNTTKAKEQ